MGNHSIGRHQYQPQQIANLLYIYMVQKGSAKDAMINALSMSPQEIGNSKQAWRIIEPIYRSFGFEKKYLIGNDTAFHKISYQKLLSYVKIYWNWNATEQDLVNYFPEIARDLAYAKELDRNKPQGSWGVRGQAVILMIPMPHIRQKNMLSHTMTKR